MNSQISEWVEAGRRHFLGRNYQRAEQELLKVLRAGGQFADVLHMLGVIYHTDGKFNDAVDCFEKALKINPNYAEANLNLAVLYNDLGEYRRARRLYEQVQKGRTKKAEINPTLLGKIANMHAELADTYLGIGRLEEAIDEYKRALRLCPTYKDIRTRLGIAYRENNQKDLSLKELSETVRTHPGYLPARVQLGLTYYTRGEVKKAAREWGAVLKRNKNHPTARMYLQLCTNHKKGKQK